MRAAPLALLFLTACTAAPEPRLPGVNYIVTEPEQIAEVACAYQRPRCEHVLGLTFPDFLPPLVMVPPYGPRTAHIWRHENRHITEGDFHPQEARR